MEDNTTPDKIPFFIKLDIWFKANFQDYPFYRVKYTDGSKTRLLEKRHAIGLRDVWNGKMYIDYIGSMALYKLLNP